MIGHKSQKQAICYCGKQATIQYGLKSLPFLQLVFYPPLLVLFFYVAFFGNGEFWARIGLLLLLGVFLFVVPIEAFVSTRRKMLKAGHSQNCSQRVALRETLYIGRFSRFAIIEKDNNG
jgi:hypothetical protein